jgi:hypothetical protein
MLGRGWEPVEESRRSPFVPIHGAIFGILRSSPRLFPRERLRYHGASKPGGCSQPIAELRPIRQQEQANRSLPDKGFLGLARRRERATYLSTAALRGVVHLAHG